MSILLSQARWAAYGRPFFAPSLGKTEADDGFGERAV
jgi:hypothetical protein